MDSKLIFTISGFALIVIVVIVRNQVKARFGGLTIDARASAKKNRANLEGNRNRVKIGKNQKENFLEVKNTLKVKGDDNDVDQG